MKNSDLLSNCVTHCKVQCRETVSELKDAKKGNVGHEKT